MAIMLPKRCTVGTGFREALSNHQFEGARNTHSAIYENPAALDVIAKRIRNLLQLDLYGALGPTVYRNHPYKHWTGSASFRLADERL